MASARLSPRNFAFFKAALFAASLLPLAGTAAELFLESPANPTEFITHETGEAALYFLVITLAMTPLRLVSGWSAPLKLRRMFGLFAFFYAFLHLGAYVLLDLQLDFAILWDDIVERKFITVGFAAFVLLVPLALTSNAFSLKRMGFAAWQKLHRAVYAIGVLGAVHFLWIKKGDDIGEPLAYLAAVCALLAMRLPPARGFISRARGGK